LSRTVWDLPWNDEEETNFPQCDSEDFHRVPQMPYFKSSESPKGGKVGDVVKEAIEANRASLEEMKKQRDYYKDDN